MSKAKPFEEIKQARRIADRLGDVSLAAKKVENKARTAATAMIEEECDDVEHLSAVAVALGELNRAVAELTGVLSGANTTGKGKL